MSRTWSELAVCAVCQLPSWEPQPVTVLVTSFLLSSWWIITRSFSCNILLTFLSLTLSENKTDKLMSVLLCITFCCPWEQSYPSVLTLRFHSESHGQAITAI